MTSKHLTILQVQFCLNVISFEERNDEPECEREGENAGADGSIAHVKNRHPGRVILAPKPSGSLHLQISSQN